MVAIILGHQQNKTFLNSMKLFFIPYTPTLQQRAGGIRVAYRLSYPLMRRMMGAAPAGSAKYTFLWGFACEVVQVFVRHAL